MHNLARDVRKWLQEPDGVDHVNDLADAPKDKQPNAEVIGAFPRVNRGLDNARPNGIDPDARKRRTR